MATGEKTHNSTLKICFIAHYAYGALVEGASKHIGGIEWQTSLMAKWFTSQGYECSIITWDEGQEDGIEIDGIRLLKMCRQDAGFPLLRFFCPRWTSLTQALKRSDADIYYYNCGDLGLGQIAMWCRINQKKSVYSVASELDCSSKLPRLKSLRERILYSYGLKHVDAIIVQTQRQQQMLQNGFGIESTVIPMPCQGLNTNMIVQAQHSDNNSPHSVLWVGRISPEKRFEWLLELAEKCPQIIFDVIGQSNQSSTYASSLLKRADELNNVKLHGYVPHHKIGGYYMRAAILCCTSIYEGFPNTFLEAWSVGLPVISTFDPDEVIIKYNLGWKASTVDELADALRESIDEPQKWQKASQSARSYFKKNHELNSSIKQFEKILKEVSHY